MQRVLAVDYMVETLLPDQLIDFTTSFPPTILLHFSQHDLFEYQLLSRIRQLAPNSQIFAFGEQPQNEQIIKVYDHGADAYLLLPLQLEDLKNKIRPRLKWYQRLFFRQKKWWQKRRFGARALATVQTILPTLPARHADLNVRFFGGFEVKNKAQKTIALKSIRIQTLFACLLYHGRKGISRNHLIRNFWPEVREDSARNSLNVAISQLRANLKDYFGEQELITLENGNYSIAEPFQISSDVVRFQHCIKTAKAGLSDHHPHPTATFLKAVEIYQGDFLSDFNFHEWTTSIRDRLWEHYLYALGKLVAHYLQTEDFQEAVHFAKLLLEEDNYHELTHRQLMYAYYRLGKRTSALQQYQSCQATLFQDLAVKPSQETEELYQIIVKQDRRKVSFPLV